MFYINCCQPVVHGKILGDKWINVLCGKICTLFAILFYVNLIAGVCCSINTNKSIVYNFMLIHVR